MLHADTRYNIVHEIVINRAFGGDVEDDEEANDESSDDDSGAEESSDSSEGLGDEEDDGEDFHGRFTFAVALFAGVF